jgi:hypothetical protein
MRILILLSLKTSSLTSGKTTNEELNATSKPKLTYLEKKNKK